MGTRQLKKTFVMKHIFAARTNIYSDLGIEPKTSPQIQQSHALQTLKIYFKCAYQSNSILSYE